MALARPPHPENSTAGLDLLDGGHKVVVTGEEQHQDALSRYAPRPDGRARQVAVELRRVPIAVGRHAGRPGVEVRLDGHRVGELTHLMAQRYGPVVDHALGAGRVPGCRARVLTGPRGLQVELRLPENPAVEPEEPWHATTTPLPLPAPGTIVAHVQPGPVPAPHRPVAPPPPPRDHPITLPRPARRAGAGADRRSGRKRWIGTGVGVTAVVALMILGGVGSRGASTTALGNASTDTPRAVPTTLAATVAPTTAPAPSAVPIAVPIAEPTVVPTAAPSVTIAAVGAGSEPTRPATRAPSPPARPAATPAKATVAAPRTSTAPQPAGGCNANYDGCVPTASDVDCAEGSGDGPKYVSGPIRVIGNDVYRLDSDHDGLACE